LFDVLLVSRKSEDELLSQLLNPTTEGRDERIAALDELISQGKVRDKSKTLACVMSAAVNFGLSKPEGSMLSQLLMLSIEGRSDLFEEFLANVEDPRRSVMIGFCAHVIKDCNVDRKLMAIGPLVNVLMKQKSQGTATKEILDTLTSMQSEKLSEEVTSITIPYAKSPNALQVLLATRVLSKTAGGNVLKTMLTVLERTLADWYEGLTGEIQDQVILYLTRCPNQDALPVLKKILLVKRSSELLKMFQKFQFRSAAQMIQGTIKENTGSDVNRDLVGYCMMVLSELDPSLLDIEKLLSSDVVFEQYWNSRFYIKKILLDMKQDAKPLLFSLLKSSNVGRYTLATECLAELGVTLDEMSKAVGESPSSEIYRFFYPNATAEKIWAERDPRILGGSIGERTRRSDFFLISVLSALNFSVLYVDSARKPGIDIVALSPSSNHMIVAGFTISSLKNDIANLKVSLGEMRGKINDLMNRYIVYSVIFIASEGVVTPDEAKFAKQSGIIVLDGTEVQRILAMSRTGRTTQDAINFLDSKRLEQMSEVLPNPFEL